MSITLRMTPATELVEATLDVLIGGPMTGADSTPRWPFPTAGEREALRREEVQRRAARMAKLEEEERRDREEREETAA